ncbi:MAG: hypothetical protein EPN39_16495 [Chitinophagaceae bacterium]|nr:MAG: hypothetical protein EPN39_16495 [Chitinophagaceae bacterium]
METQTSTAVNVARDHINAWGHQDWEKTREMLATDVHAIVTSTQSGFERNFYGSEFTGIDEYMVRKMKAASLIEPESVHEVSAMGDESNAVIVITMRIGLGTAGAMVTMVRSCVYLLDGEKKIREERDAFYIIH